MRLECVLNLAPTRYTTGTHFSVPKCVMWGPAGRAARPPDRHPLAHFRISGGIRLQTSSNLPVCDKEPITEYAFQIPPTGTRGRNWWRRQLVTISFRELGATARDAQSAQVSVRGDEINPLCHPAIAGANASGSLLRRSTKLATAGEGLHPSRRRRTSSSSKGKLLVSVAR